MGVAISSLNCHAVMCVWVTTVKTRQIQGHRMCMTHQRIVLVGPLLNVRTSAMIFLKQLHSTPGQVFCV
jgi:hypothetical protein